MTHPTLILIGGPTASGKSAKALEIAERERGTIINADAMQVYAGLPILTSQPGPSDTKLAPHELYAIIDPAERFSVGQWLPRARRAIRQALDAGRTPIVIGGTGLYFKALTEGLADIPDIPEDARAAAQQLYAELGPEKFRAELAKLDPGSVERLKPNDKQRLIRAYEVARHTGKPIGSWQKQPSRAPDLPVFNLRRILIMPPREELYATCDKRFLKMMERGALEEVRALLARKLDPGLPAMKILGVRELGAFLNGELTRETAIAKAQQATRNYAKRQMTWFRNQWKTGDEQQ